MRLSVRSVILGWLAGLLTFWAVVSLGGGWYNYELIPASMCRDWRQNGHFFPPGSEMVGGSDTACTLRWARFHWP